MLVPLVTVVYVTRILLINHSVVLFPGRSLPGQVVVVKVVVLVVRTVVGTVTVGAGAGVLVLVHLGHSVTTEVTSMVLV